MSIIKQRREQLGFTQVNLAEETGLSLRTIQRLEASNHLPKGHSLQMLSKAFNLKPSELQAQFQSIKSSSESDLQSIKLINLSSLAFLCIPFGNLIVPIILWSKMRQSILVDKVGRRIINFQIIWSVITSLLLCLSPFLDNNLFASTPLILIVLLVAIIVNITVITRSALSLNRHQFDILDLPVRFL